MASSRVAWWPGGRTEQKAFSASPSITASVAATAAPAARSAAFQVPGLAAVSGSSAVELAAGLDLLEQLASARRRSWWVCASSTSFRSTSGASWRVQRDVQAGGEQVVVDRVEPLRALRVAGAHVVAAAIGVAVEGGAHVVGVCRVFG